MDQKEQLDFRPGSPVRAKISEEFFHPKWKSFREWFFKNFDNNQQTFLQTDFYNDLSHANKAIAFVPWFMTKYIYKYIFMLERDYKLPDGTITKSFLPAQQSFQIKKDNKIVHFTAFADLFNDDTALLSTKRIRIRIQQSNYTNAYMRILGEHILSLHDKVSHICSIIEKSKVSDKGKEKAIASIQPPPEIKDFKVSKPDNIKRWLVEKYKKDLGLNPLHVIEDRRNNIPTELILLMILIKSQKNMLENRSKGCSIILGKPLRIFF